MKNYWLTALLCIAWTFAGIGCGSPKGSASKKRHWVAPQTGTNIGRWETDGRNAASANERTAKPKKTPKAKKPKPERQERPRAAADEEIVTRGGFR